jgi:predicted permease
MIATVLLIATGLLLKSMLRVLQQPSGVVTDHVLTFRVSLPDAQYQALPQISSFFTQLQERIVTIPGVKSVGASSGLPMAFASGDWSFDIEGRPAVMGKHAGKSDWYVVTPGYFETLGIQLVRGRLPQSSDTAESEPVIFLNESTAKALFGEEDPIGYRMKLTSTTGPTQPWRTIAGVVKDVRTLGLEAAPHAEMYIPQPQFLHFAARGQVRSMSVVVRSTVEPLPLMPTIRAEIAKLDPLVPAAEVRDMETVVQQSTADRRMTMSLVGTFGLMAVILAIIGVYGVMDYTVLQRRREIGVRLAIGATREAVQALIVKDGMRVVAMGVAAGAIVAAAFASIMASLLFDVRPRDVAVYGAVAVLVAFVGLLATYVPARRGSKLDPMVALRAE